MPRLNSLLSASPSLLLTAWPWWVEVCRRAPASWLPPDWRLLEWELLGPQLTTSAPRWLQPWWDEGRRALRPDGNSALCKWHIFSRFWERRWSKGTVCSVQEHRIVSYKQYSLNCFVAVETTSFRSVSPVKNGRVPSEVLLLTAGPPRGVT